MPPKRRPSERYRYGFLRWTEFLAGNFSKLSDTEDRRYYETMIDNASGESYLELLYARRDVWIFQCANRRWVDAELWVAFRERGT